MMSFSCKSLKKTFSLQETREVGEEERQETQAQDQQALINMQKSSYITNDPLALLNF